MIRLVVCTFIGASVLAALPHYASKIQHVVEDRRQAEAADGLRDVAAAQAELDAAKLDAEQPAPRYVASYAAGSSMRLPSDAQGHFIGEFRINGRPVTGMVDTGATYVALNMSTARKIGVEPDRDAFTYGVETASGRTSAARIVIDRMEIGPVRVDDVIAFVLEDSDLSTTLIGMSFMNGLQSYRVEGGELLLID